MQPPLVLLLRKHLMKVFVILFIYIMLLLYDDFVIKEFEREYDKVCEAALRSIEGTVLYNI